MLHHTSTAKLNNSRLRSLILFAFIAFMLFTFCPETSGQISTAKSNVAHSKRASERLFVPEDVYFDAEAREVSPTTSLSANQMSATSIGSVLSLLFDSARVDVQSESDPLVATWSGTITVPVKSTIKRKPKSYVQDIRGLVNKTADARVTIFLDLGGKSFTIEFPYGMKHGTNIRRRFISPVKPLAAGRYTASILIFAERRNPKSALLVDIDGLDVDSR